MDYLDRLEKLKEDIEKDANKSHEGLSKIDLKISDILHAIEFGTFDSVKGYHLAKMLKDAQKERREIKSLQAIYFGLAKKKSCIDVMIKAVKNNTNDKPKKYSFRSEECKKIFGETIDGTFKIPILKKPNIIGNIINKIKELK